MLSQPLQNKANNGGYVLREEREEGRGGRRERVRAGGSEEGEEVGREREREGR